MFLYSLGRNYPPITGTWNMDTQNPPSDTDTAPTSRICHKCLMQQISAAIPFASQEEWAEKWDQARELYDSLAPRDPAEAALAAMAVAAFIAAMDNYSRASRPSPSRRRQTRRGRTLPAGSIRLAPGAEPIKHHGSFQPRDRHGNPIPLHRFQDMTPAQRRATYIFPRSAELEAIAVAEQEAMIAQQAAQSGAASST